MEDKKRLAIVTTHPIQYNAPLFTHLTRRNNIEIKVFYTWGQSSMENKFDPGFGKVIDWDIPLLNGYPYEFIRNTSPSPGSHHYKGIINPDIIERIDAFRPDAILVFGWNFNSHMKVLRHYKKKIPLLFRGDSTLLDDRSFSIRRILRQTALTWVYRNIDMALYVGKNNRDYFQKMHVPEKNLVFLPHAIDLGFFEDKDEQFARQAIQSRRELGIKDNELVFLFAGKLQSKKNPGLLVEAFRQLNHKDVHLVIVGNGELEATLKEQSAGANIHFIGFQNQSRMPVIYRMADVVVLPSKENETWGLAVNEAMACGRPVLVSDQSGCARDLVIPGKNGFIFRSGDAGDLLKKMTELVARHKELPEMGRSSYTIIQDWSYDKVCRGIESLMERVGKN